MLLSDATLRVPMRASSQRPSLWHRRGRPLRGQACGSHSPRTPCARGLRLHPVGGFLWKDLFVRCTLSGTNKGCTVATQALTLDATNAEVAKLAEYLDTALQSGRACVNLTMSCGRRWTDVVDNHHHSFRRARRPAGCGCAPSGGAVCGEASSPLPAAEGSKGSRRGDARLRSAIRMIRSFSYPA